MRIPNIVICPRTENADFQRFDPVLAFRYLSSLLGVTRTIFNVKHFRRAGDIEYGSY